MTFSLTCDIIIMSGGDANPSPSEGRPQEPSKGTPSGGAQTFLQEILPSTRFENPRKKSQNPLTSRSQSAIIRAQVEARQSPKRVRPMRVRKTKPMKPPQGKRGILCGIRSEELRDPKGFKCAPIPPSGCKGGSGILNHTSHL